MTDVRRVTSEQIIEICERISEQVKDTKTYDEQWELFGIHPDDALRIMLLIVDFPAEKLRNELEQKVSFAFTLGLEVGRL